MNGRRPSQILLGKKKQKQQCISKIKRTRNRKHQKCCFKSSKHKFHRKQNHFTKRTDWLYKWYMFVKCLLYVFETKLAKLDFNILKQEIKSIPLQLSLRNRNWVSLGLYKNPSQNENLSWILQR